MIQNRWWTRRASARDVALASMITRPKGTRHPTHGDHALGQRSRNNEWRECNGAELLHYVLPA